MHGRAGGAKVAPMDALFESAFLPDEPSYVLEADLMDKHKGPVAGLDEAGRGPWAGPVVAASVILNPDRIPEGLNDSKKLTEKEREARFEEIMATAIVGIAIGHVKRIDRDNILQASLWAMRRAFRDMEAPAVAALIDGNLKPKRFPCPARPVVGGDGLSVSIAAASIVAKVTRDRMMVKLSKRYRKYGWERNKGYGTPEHAEAIRKHGVCLHHRRSFSPIEKALDLVETAELQLG
ncbi:MAG: ribonuclease HII [Methyloligella sp. ZOD6]